MQFVTPNEMTSIVTMSIKIGEVEGLMNVCIPYAVLEPVIDTEVMTVNLDEYKGLSRENDQSYYYFMHQNLHNLLLCIFS